MNDVCFCCNIYSFYHGSSGVGYAASEGSSLILCQKYPYQARVVEQSLIHHDRFVIIMLQRSQFARDSL